MADVISLKQFKNKQQQARTLCREGHHKWKVDQEKQFDSRQGRLVTIYICSRCGEKKIKLL